jgi:membrane peptidoglycan carboxypeptidase
VTGGTLPAQIWHTYMTEALQGQPVEQFASPGSPPYNRWCGRYQFARTWRDARKHGGCKHEQSHKKKAKTTTQRKTTTAGTTTARTTTTIQTIPTTTSEPPPTTIPPPPTTTTEPTTDTTTTSGVP